MATELNAGDTAWLLVSTALVMLMVVGLTIVACVVLYKRLQKTGWI